MQASRGPSRASEPNKANVLSRTKQIFDRHPSRPPPTRLAPCAQNRVRKLEEEALVSAGKAKLVSETALMLESVKQEWSALRTVLRRRLGAARTLLLTDGACRLHAVQSDRLEQVKKTSEWEGGWGEAVC